MLESFLGLRCGNRVIKGAKGFNLPWICHDLGDMWAVHFALHLLTKPLGLRKGAKGPAKGPAPVAAQAPAEESAEQLTKFAAKLLPLYCSRRQEAEYIKTFGTHVDIVALL